MKTFSGKLWMLYSYSGSVIWAFAVVLKVVGIGGTILHMFCTGYIYLFAASVLVISLLHRRNIVKFTYTVSDRKSLVFRLMKYAARKEKSIWGNAFSQEYYRTYLD